MGQADLGSLPGVLTPPGPILKPVFDRKSSLSKVVLAKSVLVPGDELDGGELIDHGEIDVEIKGSVLLWEGRIQRLFDYARLLLSGKA